MNTRNTAVRVRSILRCAKVHYHTRTRVTRFKNTAGLPVPVLNPTLPDLSDFLDISANRLRDMEDSASLGDDDPEVFDMPLEPDAASDSSSVPGDDEDDDDSD